MRLHPSSLMLRVWVLCVALFVLLPFQLELRTVTVYGFLIFGLFLFAFVAGTLIATPALPQRPFGRDAAPDFRIVDRVLLPVILVAIVVFGIELQGQRFFDLSAAFLDRNDRATALLIGSNEGGSLFFQIGFVLYPASFIFITRTIAYDQHLRIWKLGIFGFLPSVMVALATGGRGSMLYAIVVAALAFRCRGYLLADAPRAGKPKRNWLYIAAFGVGSLVALNYFTQVFLARAEVTGGVRGAFDHAALDWGVSFDGSLSGLLMLLLGEGNMYILFIFGWYLVQGLVISNAIFSGYDGPAGYGIYGVDLVTAIARRVDGNLVSDRFLTLLDMNVYGFLPSAFGSLYVDFKFFGVVVTFVWGYLAGLVYRNIRRGEDPRWLMAGPIVTMGIVFSFANTPIGFNNGLMTHAWLVVALVLFRVAKHAEQANREPRPLASARRWVA